MNATALSHGPPLTIDEVAERWRYSTDSVRRLIRAGKLACLKIGPRKTLVPLAAVEEYEQTALRVSLNREGQTIETATLGQSSEAKAEEAGASARDRMRMIRAARSGPSKNT